MNAALLARQLTAAAAAVGAAAVDRATGVVAGRAAQAFPEVQVETAPGAVVLRGRGLLARAFGTRRRAADPRFEDLKLPL